MLNTKKAKKLSVSELAEYLGCSAQLVRIMLQKGSCPYGFAVKGSGNRFTYFIFEERVKEYEKNMARS